MISAFLRKFKWTFEVYNYFQKRALSYNLPLYKKYGIAKKYYSSVSSVDFEWAKGEQNYLDVANSSEVLPKLDAFQKLDPDIQNRLITWSDKGYAILDGFFSPDEIDEANNQIDDLIAQRKAVWKGNKIMFAIHQAKSLYDMGEHEGLKGILELLMGKKVDLFQSINFLTGSQQRSHSDSVHMTTFPFGNIIACWIALEDIKEGSGELHYYPGSHKLPYIMNKDYDNEGSKLMMGGKSYTAYEDRVQEELDVSNLQKETFLAKKGDVLIWHANLLHGGEPVKSKDATRKSMVFHYYAQDAICYHEITQRPTLKRRFKPDF